MSENDVHAELGEVVNGTKPGRETDDEIIVCDLTGTGAQDAAIGGVAWRLLSDA
jgi:ornithine cyclodeaminase/alanine dehydrogenase-like protein (mu-crystallin family)